MTGSEPSPEDGLSEAVFGAERPFTIGVEEELFLVDPLTGVQANTSGAVVARVGEVPGAVERELHACQVELISPVSATATEAVAALGAMRRAVREAGAGLIGSGTHPSAPAGSAEITDKERYERIRELLGDAVLTPVAGLHVHVGMPDAATAIQAFNGLRERLPLLQALSANSPYRHGRDTGLASGREMTMRSWPRTGLPRALDDYADFCALARLVSRAAGVPDYTWFWWKLRPHPRLGTVEVRALDAQTSLGETAALAALVHCLTRHAVEHPVTDPSPPELVAEGLFRASRFGVDARLPDRAGDPEPLATVLERALADCDQYAGELGCGRELEALAALVTAGGGAGRQRAIAEVAGMDSLLAELVAVTGRPGQGPAPAHPPPA